MREILFNKMYTGSYTDEFIGQEIINNFKADNGKQYIYVTPHGGIGKGHNNQVEDVLFTSSVFSNKFEILSKATGLKQINFSGNEGDNQSHAEQEQFIRNENITFGGKLLNEIFLDNPNYKNATFITFEANKIVRPKKKIFVIKSIENCVLENEDSIEIKIDFSLGHMTAYLDENSEYYHIIKEVMENQNYWKEESENAVVDIEKYQIENNFNFLELIKKEDDENIFTNLMYYYFKNSINLFNEFAKEYLGIEDNFYNIEREKTINDEMNKGRIDLWAESNNNIIIIENKIMSGLNGLDKENNISQLDTYYKYAEAVAEGRKIIGVIFVPNYNKKFVEQEKSKYSIGNEYSIITYNKLYKFFNDRQNKFADDKYYKDFVKSLFKHTLTPREKMERKFVIAIKGDKIR